MTAFTEHTDVALAIGKPWSSQKSKEQRDNLKAFAEGNAPAGYEIQSGALEQGDGVEAVIQAAIRAGAVGQTEIGASAVGQGELKTTTASGSVVLGSAGGGTLGKGTYTLTGGTYSWWTAGSTSGSGVAFGNTDTAAGVLGLQNLDPDNSRTFYVDERYVQASPPYDLGDGAVPLFIFVIVDNTTREIVGTSVAQDPPWAYHGPTKIRPHLKDKQGNKYRIEPDTDITLAEALADPAKRALYRQVLQAYRQDPVMHGRLVEITQAVKNADMNIVPHPFMGNDLTGRTVIMLDPMSPLAEELMMLQQQGANITRLLHANRFRIDNTELPRRGPAGIRIVSADWKNTP